MTAKKEFTASEVKKEVKKYIYQLTKDINVFGRKTYKQGSLTKEEYLLLSKLNANFTKFITVKEVK